MRLLGFFFNTHGLLLRVKSHHTVAFGIVHMVGKHGGTGAAGAGMGELLDQVMPMKNIVAQHQRAGLPRHKAAANDEGLRQAVWAGLHRIRNIHAPLASVAQEFGKAGRVLRGGDQQHLADAGQHQGAQGVVDHRLVVHRHQLLADCLRNRVKPRTRAAGQNDAFSVCHG